MNYLVAQATAIRLAVSEGTEVPDDSDDLFVIYALLSRVKGHDVTLEDVHDAWSSWMVLRGQNHRSVVPFHDLSREVQSEDEPFLSAIKKAQQAAI